MLHDDLWINFVLASIDVFGLFFLLYMMILVEDTPSSKLYFIILIASLIISCFILISNILGL